MYDNKPVIGVMPLFDDNKKCLWMQSSYIGFLSEQGAVPIVLPLESDPDYFLSVCDGFLFTGGHDISPCLYGEKTSPACDVVSPERDRLEKSVLPKALEKDLPVLGICRGMQFINATLGGTLCQDLPSLRPSDINHRVLLPLDAVAHDVKILNDTPLFNATKCETLPVNSRHHQAVEKLAPTLKPMAISADGITEAFYHPQKRFVWGVQWHPENMYTQYPAHRNIAKAFAENCKRKS